MEGKHGVRAALRIAAAAAVLYLLLIQPNHPAAMTWGALLRFPLELPVILAGLVALPGRAGATFAVRIALVATLGAIAVLKLADYATFLSYSRGFNPVVDLHLLEAAWRLGSGAIGVPLALGAAACAVLAILGVLAAAWWATGVWAGLEPPRAALRWRLGLGLGAAASASVAVAEIGQARGAWSLPARVPAAAFTARVGLERVQMIRRTTADLRSFSEAASSDAFAGAAGLFDLLGRRDVLFIYVESYGRASFDVPFYAARHSETLRAAEERLEAAGLAMRSGWLTAPMIGGQSWLTHASVASGLWIADQVRYRALLASPRLSLFHLAREAGFHTAAVMPALTYDWPEGSRMGFETVLAARDLGYAGPPFNWVTMPDQFTLAALDRLLGETTPPGAPPPEVPLFAQVALISSHAPWTPVPEMLPWESLGDGSVFGRWDGAGDPPEVVWRNPERVRAQYRDAVDYALEAATSYAERSAGRGPLIVLLGDHQTADFISGSASFDVPVHVIGPPEVVARVGSWGWSAGMVPDAALSPWRMDAFRDRFVGAFSSGAHLARSGAGG